MLRIVLTGGPGAGKTVVSQALARLEPERLVRVPEAATEVYDALATRWDRLDLLGRRDVQRRIYHLQVEQEEQMAREHAGKILILDRGTVDGAAYWPEGPEDYWRDLGTSIEKELARYDAIIHLQSAATIGIYDGDASNPCRFEDAEAAVAAGNLVLALYGGHPSVHRVRAYATVEEKVGAVREAIEQLRI